MDLIYLYVYFVGSRRHALGSSIFALSAVGLMVLGMIGLDRGITSLYSNGLLLVFCSVGVFAPFTVRQTALIIAPSLVGFLLLPAISTAVDLQTYAVHSIFPVAGALLGLGSASLLEQLRFSDFLKRSDLLEAQERLKALDAAKSRFTANVHHELRTPLTLILAPLEGILSGSLGKAGTDAPQLREHLEVMHANGMRLLRLINNLLDVAKLESHQFTLRRTPTDVRKLVEGVLRGARGLAERKRVELIGELPTDLPMVNLDREALEKVLVNLTGNALKFTDAGGRITVSVTCAEDALRLEVADTGLGIPQDQLSRIFDRFAQVDMSATRRHEGTGIGLSLVRELVELHHGTVWATSDGIGQGTQFHLALPMGEADQLEDEQMLESADSSASAQRAFSGLAAEDSSASSPSLGLHGVEGSVPRSEMNERNADPANEQPSATTDRDDVGQVLIVEDNSDMRRLLANLLSSAFTVRTACNGREGLDVLAHWRPDAVLSDVMMPVMTGLQLCASIKKDPELGKIPVILVTSKAEREMRVQGLQIGADDYVVKPFHPAELLARVRTFVRIRRLTRALEQRNEDLESAFAELKMAQSQLVHRAKMHSLGQLVSGVAHEINNPVNFIQGNLYFLEDYVRGLVRLIQAFDEVSIDSEAIARARAAASWPRVASDLEAVFRGIREGVERTVRIVGDLRVFSRLDRAEVIQVDLHEALDCTLTLLGGRTKEVEVHKEYGEIPALYCLAGQLNQVFMNLLTNALDALGPNGRIWIRTGVASEGHVFIEIEDNGMGMEPDVVERIFEPFFTTKDVGKGTGLGLSITYGVIQRHGGSIEVRSVPQHGTCFRIVLPVRSAGDPIADQAAEPQETD
jgi:signal transduction histidine kinase